MDIRSGSGSFSTGRDKVRDKDEEGIPLLKGIEYSVGSFEWMKAVMKIYLAKLENFRACC